MLSEAAIIIQTELPGVLGDLKSLTAVLGCFFQRVWGLIAPSETCLRMDCNVQRFTPWCFVLFYFICTVTESSSLVHSTESSATNSYSKGRTNGSIQPQLTAVKRRQNAETRERPRPVAVKCHPDSMEVVVQADMFDTGLRVDGRHLRLGSDSAGEEKVCGAVPSGEAEFTIRTPLMDCGINLSVSAVYLFIYFYIVGSVTAVFVPVVLVKSFSL